MKIRFIGDVHIGKRPSHSTKQSAARHAHLVDSILSGVTDEHFEGMIMQVGDLFDTYQVSNTDFVRAVKGIRRIDGVLLGNHDRANNTTYVPALKDLAAIQDDCTIVDNPLISVLGDNQEVLLYAIPHMPCQQDFLEECQKALDFGQDFECSILMLHTNMYPEGFEGSHIENNLSEELARKLAEKFDLVVSGHEHNSCIKQGVHMVGSIVPYGFGEVTDKSILDYDTELKEVTRQATWDLHKGYKAMACIELMKIEDHLVPDFVEVVGKIKPEQVLPLAKRISKLFQETPVIAIKNSCKMAKAEPTEQKQETGTVQTWQEVLRGSVNQEQWELFETTLGELK